ncbi:MAG: hypothetical protein ACRDDY_13575, partial [Clostridium sp.]|uniref:hypothetical protein n=1 Tax=Clostridium sp. TaxID=1506 RepID=UPI003EE5DD24
SEGTILELTCKSPINTNALVTNLLISTTPEVYRYTGFNNRKLKDVSNLSSYELYPLSSKIILDQNSPTDLSKSIFEIIFNKPIDIDETKDANNVIQISGTLVTSTGPSPTSYGEFISLASLQFGNILELRSDLSTDSVPLPTDPAKLTFTANLVVSSNKLTISFSSVSNILEYFNSKFIFFELLPVGYKLFASNDGSSLNESVTIKLPFNFPS